MLQQSCWQSSYSQCCANGDQMYTRLSTSDVELLLAVIECCSLDCMAVGYAQYAVRLL